MIEKARINLKDEENVIFVDSYLSTVELPEPVDIIFSNAVIHWIKDHYRLFKQLLETTKTIWRNLNSMWW